MKKYIILFVIVVFGLQVGLAQDDETQKPKKTKDRPVTEMFGSSLLIDEQTSVIPAKIANHTRTAIPFILPMKALCLVRQSRR